MMTLTDFANRQRWVAWRLWWEKKEGPPTKVPYNPQTGARAKVPTDPSTYGTRKQAEARARKLIIELRHEHRTFEGDGAGIGIVLGLGPTGKYYDGFPLVGIDLDHCRNPETGELSDLAV